MSLKYKIDFHISAAKYKRLFITSSSLTLLRRQRHKTLQHRLLYETQIVENVDSYDQSKIKDNKKL